MKKITVDGNEACANISYMFTEVVGIFPIAASSRMAEHIDEWSSQDRLNIFNDKVKVVEMQSEAGASGMVHGTLRSGCYTSTYTASQGLLLMIHNMYKMAGEMLPCTMHVAARSLATHALSIFGDHQDIYACRSTGFCMLASSSVQDASNLAAVTHLSAIKSSLPFMHFFDGFRTSHEIDKIDALELKDIKDLIDKDAVKRFRERALNPLQPYTIGTAQNDDIYFQTVEARNKYYDNVPDIVDDYMDSINKITGMNYKPFNYYGSMIADRVIVAMGSVCETIKETIDYLMGRGINVGLIEVHLYRPFSKKYLERIIPSTVRNIAVLDRTKETGSKGPLYLDILDSLQDSNYNIVGGRYGLSSKNTTPSQICAVYEMLKNPKDNFTIGITDDVTNLSLEPINVKTSTSYEILIYGYGSDGMVSASKSFMKLIGNNTDKYVQGYFQYDSKKSGGVTKCHLRFNDKVIRSTYYVENPSIVVVTKESYLDSFDCISNINNNGIFILNTKKTRDEIVSSLNPDVMEIIKNKNITFYIIDAYDLGNKVGLPNRISTIMESILAKLTNLMDYNKSLEIMKDYAKNRYFKKGDSVIRANYRAIDEAYDNLVKVDLTNEVIVLKEKNNDNSNFSMIERRLGDSIPVSKFDPDGVYEAGTSALEKRGISDLIPRWTNINCIECNMCSLYCPHGVIRPYLLSSEEYDKAPNYIKDRCIEDKDNYFIIGISAMDCTGCGVCAATCPGKKGCKALTMENVNLETKLEEQKIFDYLDKKIDDKNIYPKNLVKGIEFAKPKFAFSGACAGCGETAYIKLLTQIYGNNLIISNATGCSSIYGASAPVTPYTVPWANSLFEDNAEYGYGILLGNNVIRNRIKNIMEREPDNKLYKKWLSDADNYQNTKYVYDNLTNMSHELRELKDYIISRVVWTIGGDGWAYDIGYSGIDHVLASNDNVNILVLDTQVYSNTGGQASKASPKGVIAEFASNGKKTAKKDLARICMSYQNAYVAQISLGANPNTTIKVMTEAVNHKGPSIIIAYSPCISHGIKGGLINSVDIEKLAATSGYFPIFHYNPDTKVFTLDMKADFDKYEDFLMTQTRYSMLKTINT